MPVEPEPLPEPPSLQNRTLFITGASRGIGLAIGLRAAQAGANVAVVAKTTEAHPKLPGTIFAAAEAIESCGGKALAIAADIRFEEQVTQAVAAAVERFSGIDILINNASAIQLSRAEQTEMKRWDLMHDINTRGTYLCIKTCLQHLRSSLHPHVLTLAPPVTLQPKWFASHSAYTISKIGMALASFGLAAENPEIPFHCLWPRTAIDTAALRLIPGIDAMRSRKPSIVADAAYALLTRAELWTGEHFRLDEEVLRAVGVTDFTEYAVDAAQPLQDDFFIE